MYCLHQIITSGKQNKEKYESGGGEEKEEEKEEEEGKMLREKRQNKLKHKTSKMRGKISVRSINKQTNKWSMTSKLFLPALNVHYVMPRSP